MSYRGCFHKKEAKTAINFSENKLHYKLDAVLRKVVLKMYKRTFKIGLSFSEDRFY